MWRYLEGMDSPEQDYNSFLRLLELERPLAEAIWRQVIYGETLEAILEMMGETGAEDGTGLGMQVRELVGGAYRHIRRVEAEHASAAN